MILELLLAGSLLYVLRAHQVELRRSYFKLEKLRAKTGLMSYRISSLSKELSFMNIQYNKHLSSLTHFQHDESGKLVEYRIDLPPETEFELFKQEKILLDDLGYSDPAPDPTELES